MQAGDHVNLSAAPGDDMRMSAPGIALLQAFVVAYKDGGGVGPLAGATPTASMGSVYFLRSAAKNLAASAFDS
jgi:hypothetical protein